jgi:hypothetical protein
MMLFFFIQEPSAVQELMDDVESTMRHTIVEEEGIPIETVTNFEEVKYTFGIVDLLSKIVEKT